MNVEDLAAAAERSDQKTQSGRAAKALDETSGYAANTLHYDAEKNTGHVSFDAATIIDPDDTDPFMWILRDQFGEHAHMFEVIEGSVKVGMHEGYYVQHETAVQLEDKTWVKDRVSGTHRMRRYTARIQKRPDAIPKLVREDLDAAIASASKPRKSQRKKHGADCAVVSLADLQLGKTQRGLGTVENLANIYDRMHQAADMLKETKPQRIVIVNPGDLLESCDGFYSTQTYDVDLNNREQFNTARQVISDHLDTFAPLAPELVFATAPSNHGEFRTGTKKTVTDPARDNKDLVIADMIAELAPFKWSNLEVETPHLTDGDPYLASFMTSTNTDARRLGVIHGHQVMSPGASPVDKLVKWWASNFVNDINRPRFDEGVWAEDCALMFTGHFHHFSVHTGKGRMLVALPAADLGSEYFETSRGVMNPAGLLVTVIDERHPHLVSDLRMFASRVCGR